MEKERDDTANVASSFKFDIKMLANGEEIQPDTGKGTVKVGFRLAEKINDCLEVNAYHLKEDTKGKLTAEPLDTEIKTVEESETENAVETADEDGVLPDGVIENDVNKEVTEIEAETYGFSYYVVEFTYDELQYVLPGDSSIKLSVILEKLAIKGTVSEASVSNASLFTVEQDEDGSDWTVTALQAFSSKEWMKFTMEDGQVYEIVVTDDNNNNWQQLQAVLEGEASSTVDNVFTVETENGITTIKLLTDFIAGTDDTVLEVKGKKNLDLNGHVINANSINRVIKVGGSYSATLNLYDSNTSTSHDGYIDTDGLWHLGTGANGEESKPITGGIITGGNKSDGDGGGVLVWCEEFNMYGGTICGNQTGSTKNGGGVWVGATSTYTGIFNMYGGEILGNLSTGGNGGGGVYVGDKGKFNMYGGKISRNKASQGGGVYVAYDDSVTLGGTAIITDNKKKVGDSNSNNNLYLSPGKTITLAEEGNLPATGMSVGVTASKTPTDSIPIQISSNYVSGAEQYFFSDVSGYSVASGNDNNKKRLYLGCSHTVTFDKNGGDGDAVPATISEINGAKYVLPTTNPTKSEYAFAGWFTEATGGTQVTTNTTVSLTAEQTLYAHWTANQYDIVYKDKGDAAFSGTHEADHPTKHTYGTETTLKTATKTGYTFGGWFTASDCSGSPITSLGANAYTANITLYAKWTANSYTVTFNKNGGDTEAEPATIEETYDAKYTLPTTVPTKAGHTFAGWFTAPTDGTQVTEGTSVSLTSDQTLYAHWKANQYEIVYKDKDDADFSGTHETGYPTEHTYGTATELKTATKAGYTFDGWFTTSDCSGSAVTSLGATVYTDNITLYAKWTPKTDTAYKVEHYQQNVNGSGYTLKETDNLTGTTETTTNAAAKTYTGFTAKPFNQATIAADGNTVVKIYYDRKTYTVSFNANGHGATPSDISGVRYGATIAAPPALTATGYTFGGWYKESACTNAWNFSTDTLTADTTLYAKWTKDKEPDPQPDPKPQPRRSSGGSSSVAVFTGTANTPVSTGKWSYDPATDTWSYATRYKFTNTWGCIADPNVKGKSGWYYFDRNGNMLTGWHWIFWNGSLKCFYFSTAKGADYGKCQLGGTTPDGYTVDASGAWTVNGAVQTR